MTERTLALVKPDGVARGLIGEVLARYEAKGLRVVALEMRQLDASDAERHYAEHVGKPFFAALERFITSGPIVAAVLEGEHAIAAVRAVNGATDSITALPGTIRGDLGLSKQENLVHGSDSFESAAREIEIFFPDLS